MHALVLLQVFKPAMTSVFATLLLNKIVYG